MYVLLNLPCFHGCRISLLPIAIPIVQSLQVSFLHKINFAFVVREDPEFLTSHYIGVQPVLLFSVIPMIRPSEVVFLELLGDFTAQNTLQFIDLRKLAAFFAVLNWLSLCPVISPNFVVISTLLWTPFTFFLPLCFLCILNFLIRTWVVFSKWAEIDGQRLIRSS